jgi:hypothetical protein
MNTWPDTDGKIIARYLGRLKASSAEMPSGQP